MNAVIMLQRTTILKDTLHNSGESVLKSIMNHPLDLTSFHDALASLQRAVTRWQATGQQDEELRDACIQRFEYTFELSWKTAQASAGA